MKGKRRWQKISTQKNLTRLSDRWRDIFFGMGHLVWDILQKEYFLVPGKKCCLLGSFTTPFHKGHL